MPQVAGSHSPAGSPSVRLPLSSCCSLGQSVMLTPCGLLRNITFAYTSILRSTESAARKPAAPSQRRDDAKTCPALRCYSPQCINPGFQGLLVPTPKARVFLQRQVVLSPHIVLIPACAKQDKTLCREKSHALDSWGSWCWPLPSPGERCRTVLGSWYWPHPSYGERCRIKLGVMSTQNKVPTFPRAGQQL